MLPAPAAGEKEFRARGCRAILSEAVGAAMAAAEAARTPCSGAPASGIGDASESDGFGLGSR